MVWLPFDWGVYVCNQAPTYLDWMVWCGDHVGIFSPAIEAMLAL